MRLRRHWLAAGAPADQMLDVVGGVCGIHAQVTASAELSLGLRVAGINRQDIRDALWKDRILVKTYGLRGTLHIFATRELPLWLAALKAKPAPREPNRIELETLALAPAGPNVERARAWLGRGREIVARHALPG